MHCFFLNQKAANEAAATKLVAEGHDEGEALEAVRELALPPILEVQWMWFPNFIATDTPMQNRLYKAWSSRWAGQEVVDGQLECADEMHEWILDWVTVQYPFVEGLKGYLKGIEQVRQAA